jgi:hypothetical protein
LQALGEPGNAKINLSLANPAIALDCKDDVPIFLKLIYLKISPKPGISLSRIFLTASGVESRPVKPVPPVKRITLIFFFFIDFLRFLNISFSSS